MARYIDAEKLLNELQKRYESALSWYENVSDPELKTRAEQAVASFLESILTIKNQPSADVQEVRHGTYINTNHGGIHGDCIYRCSCCGNEREAYIEEENYCPNCGAKMDGKE